MVEGVLQSNPPFAVKGRKSTAFSDSEIALLRKWRGKDINVTIIRGGEVSARLLDFDVTGLSITRSGAKFSYDWDEVDTVTLLQQ